MQNIQDLNNLALNPIQHKEQRVLTTKQLAEFYGCETRTISDNFNRNQDRFAEVKHYFCLEGEALKRYLGGYPLLADNLKFTSKLYLWTGRGAARHAKILSTDRAWEVFEELEDTYFRVQAARPQTHLDTARQLADTVGQLINALEKMEVMAPKAHFYDAVTQSDDELDMQQVAKVLNLGFGRNTLFDKLRADGILMDDNSPYQKYVDAQYFRLVETTYTRPDGTQHVNIKTVCTQKGLDFINRRYNFKQFPKQNTLSSRNSL